jgi:magnesium chelatase family protein
LAPIAAGNTPATGAIDPSTASSLIQIANHFKGTQVLSRPSPKVHEAEAALLVPR